MKDVMMTRNNENLFQPEEIYRYGTINTEILKPRKNPKLFVEIFTTNEMVAKDLSLSLNIEVKPNVHKSRGSDNSLSFTVTSTNERKEIEYFVTPRAHNNGPKKLHSFLDVLRANNLEILIDAKVSASLH